MTQPVDTLGTWRVIPSTPNYEVSDRGEVRRLDGRPIKPYLNPRGYMAVGLWHEKHAYNRRVHRLVLEAFVSPCPDGMVACHYDGDRQNNNLNNLRWDTPKNNVADTIRQGIHPHGETHGKSKLTPQQVNEIKEYLKDTTLTQRWIAKQFGISQVHVCTIGKGQTWRHL